MLASVEGEAAGDGEGVSGVGVGDGVVNSGEAVGVGVSTVWSALVSPEIPLVWTLPSASARQAI